MITVKLYHGDCIQVMQTIEAKSIDMIVTDPPYGINFQSKWSKKGPRHRKLSQDEDINSDWLAHSSRLLADNGGLLCFCSWTNAHEWRERIESAGLKIISQVIWDREHHGMGDLFGAFAPQHDVIWYAVKGRRLLTNGRPKSVLRHKRPSPSEDYGHPTCKPVDLMTQLCLHTGAGTVLDPFMGSGSTGVACAIVGRSFVGIELDATYFATAKERINQAFGGKHVDKKT